MMDYGNGIKFVSNDSAWVGKLSVAGMLLVSVIGFPAVIGWMVEISRRAAHEEEDGLPDWSEIGEYFLNGLTYFVVTAIWVLPFFILTIGLGTFLVISSNLNIFPDVPKETLDLISFGLNLFGMVNVFTAMMLSIPLIGLLGDGYSPLKMMNPIHAFRLFIHNIGTYLRVIIMGWFGSLIMLGIGMLACGVGVFIGGPYAYAYFGYLVGKAHAAAIENSDVRLGDTASSERYLSDQESEMDEIPPAI